MSIAYTFIPRENWLKAGKGHNLLVFICPKCRMFTTAESHLKISKSGVSSHVVCNHSEMACTFEGKLKLEAWQEKNKELYNG